MQKIVPLQQLIGKFGERQTVACFAVQALLHTVFGHHVVDGDVFANFARKVEEGEIFHPIVVVDHLGCVGQFRVKVEKARHLRLDALLVVIKRFGVQQIAFLAFARRIAYHARGAAHQNNRFVATALKMPQHHNAAQMPDVQTVGCRVGAEIGRNHLFCQQLLRSGHHLRQHTAPFKFFYKIHCFVVYFPTAKIRLFIRFTNNLAPFAGKIVHF